MIHVLTVHWQDDRWIDVQRRALDRHLTDYRVYASLNGVDERFRSEFDFFADLDGTHPQKLDELARIASADAAPDDLLLFLDGDAFPIAPVGPELLAGFPLVAVRRDENLGSCQPHPCFCMTSVGFWSEIGGTWRSGYTWTASSGDELTDVGGDLLGILARATSSGARCCARTGWISTPCGSASTATSCTTTARGSGRRCPTCRPSRRSRRCGHRRRRQRIPASVPVLGKLERSARFRLARRRMRRDLEAGADAHQARSDEVYGWITTDDEFFRRFQ